MSARRYGAPLLRGALTTGLVARRGEDAATPRASGWFTSTVPPDPAPVSPVPAVRSVDVPAGDLTTHLCRIAGLAAQGVITGHEFTAAKAQPLCRERWW
jgi:hypothetical protein